METLEIKDYKYNTLFPNSIISKQPLSYGQMNKQLDFFLFNNFSKNSPNNYKFPIVSPLGNKKIVGRQKSIKNSQNSTKNNIRALIDSLRRDNYISYNYYDNIKGRLQSAKNNCTKLIKHKSYNNINNSNSINDSNYNNINLLSFDSNINFSKRNSHKIKKKNSFFLNDNNSSNLNNFSFTKYILSHKGNRTRNSSTPHTPMSTRFRSRMNKSFLKLEFDSLLMSNSGKKNSGNRSSFSLEMHNRNEKNLKNNIKFNTSDIKFSGEQRKFHQKIYMKNLKEQVSKFENSNAFYVDDAKLQSNLISPFKFQRNIFKKNLKRAERVNDFFFKKIPIKDKYDHLQFKRKKFQKRFQSSYQNFINEKSKKIIKKIHNLKTKANFFKKDVKNIDFKLRTKQLKNLIDIVVPVHHDVKEIDEHFKEDIINYQKKIGKFYIYKGNGLFENHFTILLKGDKIDKENIKSDNI